jgi:YD repeat-containing protein
MFCSDTLVISASSNDDKPTCLFPKDQWFLFSDTDENNGNLTTVTDRKSQVTTYTYDAASQLTAITYKQGATVIGELTYTYDVAGNLIKTSGAFSRTTIPPALTTTPTIRKRRSTPTWLHSALGNRSPEEFEHAVAPVNPSGTATRQFFRPAEGSVSEGTKRVKKNVRSTRVCSFWCLTGGVHPNLQWLNCGRIIVSDGLDRLLPYLKSNVIN